MQFVENHERQWGLMKYPGRPSLTEILNARVVVFWRKRTQDKLQITLHNDFRDIEVYYIKNVMRLSAALAPDQVAEAIFASKRPVKIASVTFKFKYEDE